MQTKIYLVTKNSDFIEGRGPMMPHLAFDTERNAHDYIMQQPGIYGSTQSKYSYGYDGYAIKEMILHSTYDVVAEKRKEILSKLTKEDIEFLGLE